MSKMLKVYPATKLRHGIKFRAYNASQSTVFFCARWLQHTTHGTPDTQANAREFWLQDEYDVKSADAVLVYGEPDDRLAGALVEAGIAIASGIPVVVVGQHPQYSTWQYHPMVYRVEDLDAALVLLAKFIPRYETQIRGRP